MKQLLLTMLASLALGLGANAQTQFKELIKTIDWNSTEEQLLSKYPSMIEKNPNHIETEGWHTTSDYHFSNVLLNGVVGDAVIHVGDQSRKLHILQFISRSQGMSETEVQAQHNKLDKGMHVWLGEPDNVYETSDGVMKYWYTTSYIFFAYSPLGRGSYLVTVEQASRDNDFRVAKWGDSKESVMRKEGKANLVDRQDAYMFSDKVAGYPCKVIYKFTNDKLTEAVYHLELSHTDKNNYIKDYYQLVDLLQDKYGKPFHKEEKWIEPTYKTERGDLGIALQLGDLEYISSWYRKGTNITVRLYREDNDIVLCIIYWSSKYHQYKEQEDRRALSQGL